jgi:hypothetical protein
LSFRTYSVLCSSLVVLLCSACPGDQTDVEVGAADCTDGRDNDEDGKIDCQDSDCYPMAFCFSPPDGGIHDGPSADLPVIYYDRGVTKDSTPPPDTQPPPSFYGRRCSYSSSKGITKCADGKTLCVPSSVGSGGFCTHQCSSQGAFCPSGPSGTKSYCGYNVSTGGPWYWYCIFLCSSNSCPHDTKCYYTSGKFCF